MNHKKSDGANVLSVEGRNPSILTLIKNGRNPSLATTQTTVAISRPVPPPAPPASPSVKKK